MSDTTRDQDLIASFLDGELNCKDIDALLAELERPEARARACRQSVLASAISQRSVVYRDISAEVRQVIAREPLLAQRPSTSQRRAAASGFALRTGRGHRNRRRSWMVPATGFALAASMALVAIVVIAPGTQQSELRLAAAPTQGEMAESANSVEMASESLRELVIAAPARSRPVLAQWSAAGPATQQDDVRPGEMPAELQQRMNAYLVNHARHGGGSAMAGSLGFARVAASPQQQLGEPGN